MALLTLTVGFNVCFPLEGLSCIFVGADWKLPSSVTCNSETLTATYGKFIAEPFERGFGATIGNSLRRVLLSSLEGSAVTQIKIRGAQHEFTTIPGVLEDVTDIVLNVKSLVVKNHSDSTRVIYCGKKYRWPDHWSRYCHRF